MAGTKVELGWEHEGQDFRVVCTVTRGTPDRGPDMSCAGGHPGDPPAVEVLEVVEDRPGGLARPDLLEDVQEDLRLIDLALDRALTSGSSR